LNFELLHFGNIVVEEVHAIIRGRDLMEKNNFDNIVFVLYFCFQFHIALILKKVHCRYDFGSNMDLRAF
jgi:hypothetical protein